MMKRPKQKNNLRQKNPKNILINREDVENILKQYGVSDSINDVGLYRTAMVHKSYLKTAQQPSAHPAADDKDDDDNCLEPMDNSYERLEFMGDTVLGSAVVSYLFARYPNDEEGFLTKLKIKLIKDQACAKLCRTLGLQKFIIISQFLETQNSRDNIKIQEDVFEAFIGAMYIDFGGLTIDRVGYATQRCHVFLQNLYEETFDFTSLIQFDDNYKDQLLRYFQRNFGGQHPTYKILSENGPTNKRVYVMGVMDANNIVIGTGKAGKKNEAEQIASRHALEHFGVEINGE